MVGGENLSEIVVLLHNVSAEKLSEIQDFLQDHAGRTTYRDGFMDYEFESGNYAVYDNEQGSLTVKGEYPDSISFLVDAIDAIRSQP